MLELRVLTGTHAGARALLSAEPQWIGSGDECALILTDPGLDPQHARIAHRPDGTLALEWADGAQPPVVLRPGQSAWVGPVRIAVESLGAPWRDDAPVATAEVINAPQTAEPTALQAPGGAPAQGHRTRAILAITLALIGLVALGGYLFRGATGPAIARPSTPQAGAQAPDEALGPLIARLGLKGRVTIDMSDPERPGVRASFLAGEEIEALANELSQRSVRPHLVVVDEAQAVQQVAQGVQRVGELFDTTLTATHLGAGRFRVEGRVADEPQRAQIASELRDTLPQVTGFEFAIASRAGMARAMVDDLKQHGVAQLQGRWEGGVLTMEARVPPGGLPRWELALLEVAQRHDVPFRIEVKGGEGGTAAAAMQLPFTVRSVVNAPQPFVILADGTKLATGGQAAGWRLVAIDRQAIRFENQQGQALIVER